MTKPRRPEFMPEPDPADVLGGVEYDPYGPSALSPCRPGHRGRCGLPDCPRCRPRQDVPGDEGQDPANR